MNRKQAAKALRKVDKVALNKSMQAHLKDGDAVYIYVGGKKLGMAYACNGYLIMVPWGKYEIGEYSDETFHPGTVVDSLEVEPSHA